MGKRKQFLTKAELIEKVAQIGQATGSTYEVSDLTGVDRSMISKIYKMDADSSRYDAGLLKLAEHLLDAEIVPAYQIKRKKSTQKGKKSISDSSKGESVTIEMPDGEIITYDLD